MKFVMKLYQLILGIPMYKKVTLLFEPIKKITNNQINFLKFKMQSKKSSHKLLLQFYYIAKFFGVVNCSLNRDTLKVKHLKRRNKILTAVLRVILISIFQGVQTNMYKKFLSSPDGYIQIFSALQTVSVTIFAIFSFLMQTIGEKQILHCINYFFKIYKNIVDKFRTNHLFQEKFFLFLSAKLVTTLLGLRYEIPSLFEENKLEIHFLQRIAEAFGTYMWIGSMLTLDGCFIGFLIIAELYRELGLQLTQTLAWLRQHEIGNELTVTSRYSLMQLLCEYADRIDGFAITYSSLYKLSKTFTSIVQWQILYYIYYNFMVILLLLHQCIYTYMHDDDINLPDLSQVAGKIMNLTLLIMCADSATRASQAPKLLCIDLICSGIDERWDTSVSIVSIISLINVNILVRYMTYVCF